MPSMTEEGFNFSFNPSACETCKDTCCSTPDIGVVKVTAEEIKGIAKLVGKSLVNFYQEEVEYSKADGDSLKMKWEADRGLWACRYLNLETRKCMIYEARPLQCSSFPFNSENLNKKPTSKVMKDLANSCEGIKLDD